MIQIIDGDLQRRLATRGQISVHSDAHISTGISKPFMFDWLAHSRATARGLHPDVTVMFLGANDGFPMGTPAGRTDGVLRRRVGARVRPPRAHDDARLRPPRLGHRLLAAAPNPAPRCVPEGLRARQPRPALGGEILPGRRAHRRPRSHLHSPRQVPPSMRWQGRTMTVRQADGVHLSVAGASIATTLIIRRMRRDGLVR